MNEKFKWIDNYIYLYHVDTYLIIPTWTETLSDTMSVKYNSETPMSRSAPIYSYSDSGPREIRFTLDLHRDLMNDLNYGESNAKVSLNEDYVDVLIRCLQACAVPNYGATDKLVNPPMVAVRFGEEIFIKGIVNGSVGVDYELPILETNKYGKVKIAFTVQEVDPYDAKTIMQSGSFRGLDQTLERNVWRTR